MWMSAAVLELKVYEEFFIENEGVEQLYHRLDLISKTLPRTQSIDKRRLI